jgi:replicative DNA helicase
MNFVNKLRMDFCSSSLLEFPRQSYLCIMIDSISDPLQGATSAGAAPDLKKSRRHKNISPEAHKLDRLPPHAPEAEQGVLGCVLLSPNECMGECIEKLKDDGQQVFYDLRHQTIYENLSAMYDAREAIDVITLQQRLKDKQLLEQIGGIAYLSQLQDSVPSAANLSYYLEIVQEKFLLRRMIATCTEVVGRVYDYEGDVETLLDEVEQDILRINESRAQSSTASVKELVGKAILTVENYSGRLGTLNGLGTGFPDLDRMTDGLHGSEMIVIAARPSMGKTSLAMNIVEHVVLEQNLSAGVFSLEMSAESLVLRMLCSIARVNLRSIREGFMSEADFPKLTSAAGRLAKAKLLIDDSAGLSILDLRARARRMHQQHGVKLFVVDYLQLLHSTSRRSQDNRQQEIADISSGIKALAKELKVPVLVLSQLNRELEKDKSRKPRLSDLRESGAIEQDADVVGLLYKPSAGDDDDGVQTEEADGLPVNLLIAKQRNGPTGDINLTFLKSYTRFESAAKVSDEDVPGS